MFLFRKLLSFYNWWLICPVHIGMFLIYEETAEMLVHVIFTNDKILQTTSIKRHSPNFAPLSLCLNISSISVSKYICLNKSRTWSASTVNVEPPHEFVTFLQVSASIGRERPYCKIGLLLLVDFLNMKNRWFMILFLIFTCPILRGVRPSF